MSAPMAPSFYFAGRFHEFRPIFEQCPKVTRQTFDRQALLTAYGRINNTAHFVLDGTMMLSLSHEGGAEKVVAFFGSGAIFPIGLMQHEHKMDYDLILRAFSPLTVLSCSYQTIRALAEHHPALSMALLEEDCDFISYLLHAMVSQAYSSSQTRVADTLWLAHTCTADGSVIEMSQTEFAQIAGISTAQLERDLRKLREDGIIKTGRKKIFLTDEQRLVRLCSVKFRNE